MEYRREIERLQPSRWRFDRCPLVPGSRLFGLEWPLGSLVYGNGYGWTLRVSDSAGPLSLEGMSLLELNLMLDGDRHLLRWDGRLAAPYALGDWDYPPAPACVTSTSSACCSARPATPRPTTA